MGDQIQRNPHPDFNKVQSERPPWDQSSHFRYTQTVNPDWAFGDGPNRLAKDDAHKTHVVIDPYAPNRPSASNYKLLISSIVPRPIAFISTRSADGSSTNLAPYSYFNVLNHDPPIFAVGFASSLAAAKDSLRNVADTREAVINIISDHFIEAANSASIDSPYGDDEWVTSGLTPDYSCQTVRCARVKEAVVSIEVKLDMLKEYKSKTDETRVSATLAIFEGTRIWVRQDALNPDQNHVDPAVLRPISRLGGITYARTTEAFELTRPKFKEELGGQDAFDKLKVQAPKH
ncbi:hypothetical protein CDD82_3380 [Ophiocordyceps australis]|uniref:Flavin reductase like domain-containing protein n=1 Tax=Ophiocordyceps australis TaxID=1399860 RepID=A0A2C5ZD56_9HYPO|nr:hypothetical protein CDD82_3380 [Ophiocordyceps australis]